MRILRTQAWWWIATIAVIATFVIVAFAGGAHADEPAPYGGGGSVPPTVVTNPPAPESPISRALPDTGSSDLTIPAIMVGLGAAVVGGTAIAARRHASR